MGSNNKDTKQQDCRAKQIKKLQYKNIGIRQNRDVKSNKYTCEFSKKSAQSNGWGKYELSYHAWSESVLSQVLEWSGIAQYWFLSSLH